MPHIGWEPSGESGLRETTVVEPEGAATGGCQTALLVAGPLLGWELRVATLCLSHSAGSLKHLDLFILLYTLNSPILRFTYVIKYGTILATFSLKIVSTTLSQFLECLLQIYVLHSHSIIHFSQTLLHIYHIFISLDFIVKIFLKFLFQLHNLLS